LPSPASPTRSSRRTAAPPISPSWASARAASHSPTGSRPKIAKIDGATLPVGTLDITLYRDDLGIRGTAVIRGTDIPFSIKGRSSSS